LEDDAIIELFWERSEEAIEQTRIKYGKYCRSIAFNILQSHEDSEECVNDTYLRMWNSIPPDRPQILSAFIGKVTRNLALDRVRARSAGRRGGGEVALALDELEDCVSGGDEMGRFEDSQEIITALNGFLETLSSVERGVFMRRYWSMEPVADIAARYGMSVPKTASMLHRMRGKLKTYLGKEGVSL
jgi:RNA polymerase sigma factor (sigma-70 family)